LVLSQSRLGSHPQQTHAAVSCSHQALSHE
jgi:hypothetical protein